MAFFDDEANNLEFEELYDFVGSVATYRMTGGAADFVFAGERYMRTALKRGSIIASTKLDDQGLMIEMPVSEQLIQDYGFLRKPQGLSLTITKVFPETGNYSEIWSGDVISLATREDIAQVMSVTPLHGGLRTVIPSKHFQRQCNHTLYDKFCTMNRDDFDANRVVDSVSFDGRTITITVALPAGADLFVGGEVIRVASGERRMIKTHGNGATTFDISEPFHTLDPGDALILYQGCDHSRATCASKFNNEANFGGQPFIPETNIFRHRQGVRIL